MVPEKRGGGARHPWLEKGEKSGARGLEGSEHPLAFAKTAQAGKGEGLKILTISITEGGLSISPKSSKKKRGMGKRDIAAGRRGLPLSSLSARPLQGKKVSANR